MRRKNMVVMLAALIFCAFVLFDQAMMSSQEDEEIVQEETIRSPDDQERSRNDPIHSAATFMFVNVMSQWNNTGQSASTLCEPSVGQK